MTQTPALLAPGAKPPKMALCMERNDAPLAYHLARTAMAFTIGSEFFKTPTRLIDRAICETDESTLQLIPYIAIVNEDHEYFVYSRGKGGEEARLHAKLSLGLGGHVDHAVPNTSGLFYDASFYSLLASEAVRELKEEADLHVLPMDIRFRAVLCDPAPGVGRVHIGILAVLHVSDEQILAMKPEVGVVTEGQWVPHARLMEEDFRSRLEPWSQAALFAID